jgi:hypothetical protein
MGQRHASLIQKASQRLACRRVIGFVVIDLRGPDQADEGRHLAICERLVHQDYGFVNDVSDRTQLLRQGRVASGGSVNHEHINA